MSIAGYAEGIRDGIFEGEGVRKGLDIILSESGRLRDLVSEMTLLAKLDSEEDIYQAEDTDLEEPAERGGGAGQSATGGKEAVATSDSLRGPWGDGKSGPG